MTSDLAGTGTMSEDKQEERRATCKLEVLESTLKHIVCQHGAHLPKMLLRSTHRSVALIVVSRTSRCTLSNDPYTHLPSSIGLHDLPDADLQPIPRHVLKFETTHAAQYLFRSVYSWIGLEELHGRWPPPFMAPESQCRSHLLRAHSAFIAFNKA